MMNLWIVILAFVIALFLSLIIRLKLEDIPHEKLIDSFILSIKYLVIYPFVLFPHLVETYKMDIAEIIWDYHSKRYKECARSRKAMIEKVAELMDRKMIYSMWKEFLKDILHDYGAYTEKNINAVKEIICTDRYVAETAEETYVDNNQSQFQYAGDFKIAC